MWKIKYELSVCLFGTFSLLFRDLILRYKIQLNLVYARVTFAVSSRRIFINEEYCS